MTISPAANKVKKALVKAKWILTICDKNISTEFCIISLLANEETQESKFFIKKLKENYHFASYTCLVLQFG